jgi:muramoyltetrapeptide carboxypeptidase
VIRPPVLVPGDRVALVAPAGPVDDRKIRTALDRCRRLGVAAVPGKSIRSRAGYLAGTDAQRAADLQAAVEADVAAIWALRGGYGTLRTLRRVDLGGLMERPRAFIGFSDNTAVHLALLRLGLVSFHGPHAGFEHFPPETEASFRAVLMGAGAAGMLPLPPGCAPVSLAGGVAEGPLVGGNLAMLAAVCGTPYQPDTRGAILFLEDVGEPLYRIDRMFQQLRLAGLLDDLAGVAVGQFTEMLDPVTAAAAEGGPSLEELLTETLQPLGVPVLLGLPFGHGVQNWTLPLGVLARLDAGAGSLSILEPATSMSNQERNV